MDSLRISGSITLSGSAVGDATNDDLNTPLDVRLVAALSSTGTAGAKATKALFFATRTLAASTSETFDLTAFSDALKDAGASMSIVRIYVVVHSDESLATSGIRVGNAATPFPGIKNTAATTDTLAVGAGFAQLIPTAAGIAVTAGMGVKVENLDVTNTATYAIGVFGE